MGLLDDISKLTTPAAQLPDIEDDDQDGTSASKLLAQRQKSKKIANFNFEEGNYAGNKVSRKDIFGDMNEISGLSGKNEDSESEEDEMDEEEDFEDEESDENEEKTSDIDEKDEESDVDDEDEGVSDEDEEENTGITKISIPTDDNHADKAECIQNQRKVWDDVMYTNIRMHALLNSCNQLPRGDARRQMIQNSSDATKEKLENALKNMGTLRKLMKEACSLFSEKVEDEDDEEIPSDEDIGELNSELEDNDDEEEEESDEEGAQKAKKAMDVGVSIDGLGKFMKKHDDEFDAFRSSTITKWYNRTKLLSSKATNNADFSSFEKGSVLGQINKILNDEGKLLKKVRTNRNGKLRIGATDIDEIDNEIFDDADFYQILLKQMIESRSNVVNNTQDGADMTRSYMELQKMFSNKKKRDVTQLSSKDRKLKYEPIAKLINFYPANPSVVTWSHESRNELFKSLFS